MRPTIILKRDLVVLREVSEEDSERIVEWRNAELPRRVFFSDKPLTVEGQRQWIRAYRDDVTDVTFVIEYRGNPVGMAALYNIREDRAEFGRLLIGDPGLRRRGLGRAAARMIIDYGFRSKGLDTIYARVFEDNKPAVKLYLSLGFRVAGREQHSDERVILEMSVTKDAFLPKMANNHR